VAREFLKADKNLKFDERPVLGQADLFLCLGEPSAARGKVLAADLSGNATYQELCSYRNETLVTAQRLW
jgi:hypothetical protein